MCITMPNERPDAQHFYEHEAITYDKRRWASCYGAKLDAIQRSIVRSLVGRCTGQTWLEVGVGTGRFTEELSDTGADVLGVDISLSMLKVARKRLTPYTSTRLLCSDASAIPLPDRSIEGAVSINVFSHLPKPYTVVIEIARVLRPHGVLVLNVPNLFSWFGPAALVVNWRNQSLGRQVYSHWYTLAETRSLLEGAGLTVRSLVGHVHVPTMLQHLLVADAIFWLDKHSRNAPLNKVAPVLFIKAEKVN